MYYYDDSTGAMYIKGISTVIPDTAKEISENEYDEIVSTAIQRDEQPKSTLDEVVTK
ncbi:hypothetical protein [Klebsiella pneumoniae]|uniref:hypothetical protein n=1 Tax=Klebsiella pneumoniae TaxID=573 RepID=UPI0024B04EA7|nr:hypothetical protein [Klebsiella pneumoniae]MDI9031433.1 hypothetical protein [Klebsiella pneumoniae]HEN5213364.1 hypothetical protein [Klebsiella pneumoniae]